MALYRTSVCLLVCMCLMGCLGSYLETTPHTPRLDLDSLQSCERIPARVAIVVDRPLRDTQSVDEVRGKNRYPGQDTRVDIGESSARFLEDALPNCFESVTFIGSPEPVPDYEFVIWPRIEQFTNKMPGVEANISYVFTFYRVVDSRLVEIETLEAIGTARGSGLRLLLLSPFYITWWVVSLGHSGALNSWDAARTFAAAQEMAFQDFLSQLPESQLAREARGPEPILEMPSASLVQIPRDGHGQAWLLPIGARGSTSWVMQGAGRG